jgi:hypothetical protein
MLRLSLSVMIALALWTGTEAEVVHATGYGTVIGGDTAGARDEAIIDARTRALEEVAGVFIDAETILENELILEATVRSTTGGLVSDYSIVSEGVNADGLYEVVIEADVIPGEYKEKIGREIARNASVVVMIPEDNMGREVHNPAVENEIVSMLVGAGFTVYDRDQLERIRDRRARIAALEGDPVASQEIGLEFLSNLVLTGRASARFSQETGGIVSARASASLRMVEVETGLILANRRVDRAKGFDLSAEEAGYKALEEAANELAKSVLGWMSSEYLAAHMREVTVEVRGLEDMNAYRTVANLLESMRWVEEVEEQGYGPAGGVFTVRYPEKLVYLASKLDRSPQVKLVEYGRGRIVLAAEG